MSQSFFLPIEPSSNHVDVMKLKRVVPLKPEVQPTRLRPPSARVEDRPRAGRCLF